MSFLTPFLTLRCLLAGVLGAALIAPVAAQPFYVPNFQDGPGGWEHAFGREFPAVPGSAIPMRQDPAHPFINQNESFRIGDLTNPNLKPWARDLMKKGNDDVLGGKIAFHPGSSCVAAGVPLFLQLGGPFHFLQTPTKVLIIDEGSQDVRHIYLNVPHSANPAPSWFGESVGRYEGDTLFIDTIGLTTKTIVDSYRTPHSEKLHVVERWKLIDDGNMLDVRITVDDPDTYYQPWHSYQRYQRVRQPLTELICAENNLHLFDYHMPMAEKPDF